MKYLKIIIISIAIIFLFLLGTLICIRYKATYQVEPEQSQLASRKLEFEQIKLNHPVFQIKWEQLEAEMNDILGSEKEKYAILVETLDTEENLEINPNHVVHPASIYKIPLAIVVLQKVDNGEIALDDKLLITEKQKPYDFDRLSKIEGDYELSIREILEYLIIYSDNTAMTVLEHRLGGVEELQSLMVENLKIETFNRLPGESKAQDVAIVMRGLYEQKFLKSETNEFLLELMKNVYERHNDRIKAGVPKKIEVAHKIGNLNTTYHDAGIVYGEKRDYVLVVLNSDVDSAVARGKIARISKVVYEYLNEDN